MATLEKLLSFLDENHVEYLHTSHETAYRAREVASAEHMLPSSFAKIVIFHSDSGYGMAVLHSDQKVDLRLLASSLGVKHVRLATEEELTKLCPDCEVGAMPPFGGMFGMPVYMDSDMAADTMIAFSAGTHRDVVHMRFQDFEALAKPAYVPLARELVVSE